VVASREGGRISGRAGTEEEDRLAGDAETAGGDRA
jgi:hypothetical protein